MSEEPSSADAAAPVVSPDASVEEISKAEGASKDKWMGLVGHGMLPPVCWP